MKASTTSATRLHRRRRVHYSSSPASTAGSILRLVATAAPDRHAVHPRPSHLFGGGLFTPGGTCRRLVFQPSPAIPFWLSLRPERKMMSAHQLLASEGVRPGESSGFSPACPGEILT